VQGTPNVLVAISGTYFASGATVAFSGTGVTVKSVQFVSASQLTVAVEVAADASVGLRDVTVTNPGGLNGSGAGLFQVRKTLGDVVLSWSAPSSGQAMNPPGNLTGTFNPSSGAGVSGTTQPAGHRLVGNKAARVTAGFERRQPSSPVGTQGIISEVEPNNSPGQAQVLTGDTLLEVSGHAEVRDVGVVVSGGDDIEDLFKVTTTSPGLTVLLSGFTSDCDLFLLQPSDMTIVDASLHSSSSGGELIERSDLPAGTYLIGISIYDANPLGPDSTAYLLQAAGTFGGTTTLTLESYRVYRSVSANARTTGTAIGSVGAGTTSFSDPVPYTGNFYYQVTAVYNQGESAPSNEVSKVVTEVRREGNEIVIPASFALQQNYPNPFNPSTVIRYGLPNRTHVSLAVFNTLGQQVALLQNGEQEAGYQEVKFDGSPLSSGVYFYRIEAGSFVQTRKLLLLK